MKLQKQKSKPKPNTNILAWVAIGISLFSLLISVSQYIRTQRPKIAIHPDTRLLSKNKINNTTENYSFGFVFQNKGNIECKGIDIEITLLTLNKKIITKSKHSSNQIFPEAVFNTDYTAKSLS